MPETEEPDWWDETEKAERDDLMVQDDTRREYIKIERPEWDGPKGAWFDLRDPSWNKSKEVLSDSIDASADGGAEMDLAAYYRNMLEYMIVDSSADVGNNMHVFLRGVNTETGQRLEEFVPEPGADALTEDEEGKSGGPSGEAGEPRTTDA